MKNRDNVYVTDVVAHSVFHFKVEAEYRLVARLGCRGSGNGQFDNPSQLAVSNNGDVLVADFCNNRIQILNGKLEYLRQISHLSMGRPLDVKLTPDEVFVLCQTSPCIKVFSYSGELLRSLVTCGGIGMQVKDPSFFCLDADRNLLLNFDEGESNEIKIFSKRGKLLHTLEEDVGGVDNLKLVVLSSNSNYFTLQIFSSN